MFIVKIWEEPIGIDEDLPDAHLFKVEVAPHDLTKIVQFLQEWKDPPHIHKVLQKRKKKNSCNKGYSLYID